MVVTEEPASEAAAGATPGHKAFGIRSAMLAVGGMIVGALVGIAVQTGVESTGLLGPSVGQLLDEQEANFSALDEQLAALRTTASDPEILAGLNAIEGLIERQQALQRSAGSEIGYLTSLVETMRAESLAENGYAGGADFWIGVGESVAVGDERHVLGLTRIERGSIVVNLNGEVSRMAVGNALNFSSEAGDCQVSFRQQSRVSDSKVGFDVNCRNG